jgi:hypothetical protein
MSGLAQGVVLFVVGCVVIYGLIQSIGPGRAASGGHGHGHGHGGHGGHH